MQSLTTRAAPTTLVVMGLQLVVIEGRDKGLVFPLDPAASVTVGRQHSAQVRITDPSVSRVHCHIRPSERDLVLSDAGSMPGTWVNGQRIQGDHILRAGDVIRIGGAQLRVDESDPADLPTVPPIPPVRRPVAAPAANVNAPPAPPPPAALPVETAGVPSGAAPVATIAALSPERLGELAGQTFWHYRLDAPLARGQSGLVFRGTDQRTQQPVAIKVLWPQLAAREEEVQRIFRATRTMYTLRHPHIITLHQAGKTGPYLWFAMDLIEGESLTQVIDRIGVAGMLDWRNALRVAQHLGEALQFAHERHIIHRNITPQNVMVRAADKCTLLGDLVLAKALEGALAQQITRPGEVLGDVRYMSPERLAGVAPVDERSDIYSLGAMLYALVTGRPPFAAASIIQTIKLVQTAAPVPPKKYQMSVSLTNTPEAIKRFQLSVPDHFQDVVMKMLAKQPEKRYQNASDLLKDLQRVAKFHGAV